MTLAKCLPIILELIFRKSSKRPLVAKFSCTQFTAVFASECKLIIFITNMFTVNCLNPGVMPSVTFPPFNRKHFVSLGEDKSLAGEGSGGGGGGDTVCAVR